MLNIYRVDHIGQVVPELEPQVRLLEGLFGFRRSQSWEDSDEGCRGVLLDVPGSWDQRWEVMAPLNESSPLQAFLDGPVGPGIHHVAVEVPDVAAAKSALDGLGIPAERRSEGPSGRWLDVPFVPPKHETGLLWRILGPAEAGACGGSGFPRSPVPAGGDEPPSLGIVGIEQVGHAYWKREELARWLEGAAGMREVYRTPEGKHPDIATLVLTLPGSRMRWEIIQPVDEESFVHRYLSTRGAFCHHVTFQVGDWDQAHAACEHHEIPTFGTNEGVTDGGRWGDTFIHPRHTGGFLVQFFWEEKPGAWSRSDKIPRPR